MGGEQGHDAAEYAVLTGDLGRPSRPVTDGPHVRLLEDHRAVGDVLLSDARLLETEYVANARRCIAATGSYFGASDDAEVCEVAREFLVGSWGAPGNHRSGRSAPGDPIRVARIRWSDSYQLIDGNHRLAIEHLEGRTDVDAAIALRSVTTPLQELLLAMSWTVGRRELYQPIASTELESWPVVRQCSDRLTMMTELLGDRGLNRGTYLDVGSCYGWFVAAMRDRGYDALGVEADPSAEVIGRIAYGLDPGAIVTSECASYLAGHDSVFDVVSCFSVLHHFALGNAPCTAEELLGLLDRATGSVLILETGEAHEEWFADVLPEWTVDEIEDWVLRNSSFREAVRLGTDRDGQPPYERNYGRTTFAFLR